jgi:hypothetical protein
MAEYSYGAADGDIARYHEKSEKCRERAESCLDPIDRHSWLSLAHDWAEMAREAERRRS